MITFTEPVLDPTGGGDLTADTTLSPRPGSLRGRTAGMVDNGKPNGAVLLHELGELLTARHGLAAYRIVTKGYFGTPVDDDLIAGLATDCDVAFAAIGD